MSKKTHQEDTMSTLPSRFLSSRSRLYTRAVSLPASFILPFHSTPSRRSISPPSDLPGPNAYSPPSPPLKKDVGPPPPGYGRYHLYDPYNPAHWQVWSGPGQPSGSRAFGNSQIPQAIPSNIDEQARSAAVNMAQRMGLRDIPDDGGKAQGGNLWRYTVMVERGLIRPPEEGGRGWKSADELRTVTCYVRITHKLDPIRFFPKDLREYNSLTVSISLCGNTALW